MYWVVKIREALLVSLLRGVVDQIISSSQVSSLVVLCSGTQFIDINGAISKSCIHGGRSPFPFKLEWRSVLLLKTLLSEKLLGQTHKLWNLY